MKKYWISPFFQGVPSVLHTPLLIHGSVQPVQHCTTASLEEKSFLSSQALIGRIGCFASLCTACFNVHEWSLCLFVAAGEWCRGNASSYRRRVLLTWQCLFIMDCNRSFIFSLTFLFCRCIISHIFSMYVIRFLTLLYRHYIKQLNFMFHVNFST